MSDEHKLKHLEFIQGIINRMASNSFLLKGWCVTLVSALFALAAQDSHTEFIWLAFFPVIMFWILDAYFLRQERLFRKKYDNVSSQTETEIDFSMNTSPFTNQVDSWIRTAFSWTLFIFYGTIMLAIATVILIVTK